MKKKYSGFTLVELLVVITILGILASIVLVAFRGAQIRGRDVQRKSDLKSISSALELFYSDYGRYPASGNDEILACPYSQATSTGTACVWGTGEFRDVDSANVTKTIYIRVMPKDPTKSFNYIYRVDATGSRYQLFARLENDQDPSLIDSSQTCGGNNLCNFAITSPNTTPTDF